MKNSKMSIQRYTKFRAVGGSENSGVPVLYGGHNLPPLVEIGLTDLPKFGGAMAPPAPPGTTGLIIRPFKDCLTFFIVSEKSLETMIKF